MHLLTTLTIISSAVVTQLLICCQGYIRSNRCYSCMSSIYQELFKGQDGMGRYFYPPVNFTDHCNDPMDTYKIGFHTCRTICLTLTQDFVVMGKKTGRQMIMRGCSTKLNKFGFYNRTMAMFDRYDICRRIPVSDLFRYETQSGTVRVCSCLGDKCNGPGINSSISFLNTSRQAVPFLLTLLFTLVFALPLR